MPEGFLRVRNWDEYQHYKNRRPVWVKFYVSQLRDARLKKLPLATRLLWTQMLLLAAEYDNAIPKDFEEISYATRIPLEEVASGVALLLQGAWLSETKSKRRTSASASTTLAAGYQGDSLEGEKEKELEESIGDAHAPPLAEVVDIPKPSGPRKRDELWDVLVELCGQPSNDGEVGRRRKAHKLLRQSGAAVDDVRVRFAEAERRWKERGIVVTDTALANNWTALGVVDESRMSHQERMGLHFQKLREEGKIA